MKDRKNPGCARSSAAVLVLLAACGHPKPPAATPASAQVNDPAPGAYPGEANHLLEAHWKEVRVKVRKNGSEVVSAIKLVAPQIRIFHAASPPDGPKPSKTDAAADSNRPPAELIDLAETFRKITPIAVDHVDVLDGQVAFVDVSRGERPELWLHNLELSIENLTTRVPSGEGRPVLLTASGTLANSGELSIFVTANPFEKGLTFSGRASIVGLETAELYRFIAPATKLQAPRGTVDIFVEFDCRNGELTGGVKPVLKQVEIRPAEKNPFTVLKAWAADLAIKIFSDRVESRDAVATVIPIKGTLTGPDVQLWPAIFGVMRNAFVEGLTLGYAHLPPVTAPKKQSVVKQGVDALTGSQPPKAQPSESRAGSVAVSPTFWASLRAAGLASAFAIGCAHTHAQPPPPAAVPPTRPEPQLGAETGIPVARTPEGLLRDGAEKRIQERLRARGLLRADQCTGQLDADTRRALRTFQKSQGLPTTGLPSFETVEHLGLDLDAIFHATPHPREPTAAPAASR